MKFITRIAAVVVFTGATFCAYGQDTSAKEDIKEAGRATKRAAKKTGSATKKTAKKAAHATASGVDKGAKKVKEKTE